MGFKEALDKIKQQRDYESEIADLKAKLQAAEQEKSALQTKIEILEKSANAITDSNAVVKQNYELQQIMEVFKKELSNLPPFASKDKVIIYERYNYLVVIIDFFCVPVLKEFGMTDLAERMQIMSKSLRSDALELLSGRVVTKALNGELQESVDSVKERFSRFVGCDEEKQAIISDLDKNLQKAQYSRAFINYVRNAYGDNLWSLIPKDKPQIKQWLEMIIGIGTLAADFVVSVDKHRVLTAGAFREVVGLPDRHTEPFSHNDFERSTEQSNRVYELLLDLSKTYGIDLSKMRVYADGQNVCAPHYKPVNLSGIERE